ncbi:MAG: hypothetical protein OJF62_000781 [Pseudolabrys sp.]|nr:hypothetical protein [Pseudolabrys sp.]
MLLDVFQGISQMARDLPGTGTLLVGDRALPSAVCISEQ